MATVTVVGAGPSALHFADAALTEGHAVRMYDVGRRAPKPVLPELSMEELKTGLDRPIDYFLGASLEGAIQPDYGSEYYGLPPSKDYVLTRDGEEPVDARGFEPLFSWAGGGLAQAWTGGSYPFNDAELEDFPFDYAELGPFYDAVAEEIGISGAVDDLARFMPVHAALSPALELDRHATAITERYSRARDRLNRRLGMYLGRSRIAVLSSDLRGRKGCSYLGRCLWGCPQGSLYTPSMTLQDLLGRPGFEYLPERLVHRFGYDDEGWARSVVWSTPDGQTEHEDPIDVLVLGAGTLGTSKIFLESWAAKRDPVKLGGLMDNRQVMVPFLSLSQVGQPFEPEAYQYNLIAIGLEAESREEYVHCLVTTLKTALVHPIIQTLPLDLKTATWAFRNVRAALGLVNVNFHDRRRPDSFVALGQKREGRRVLQIRYEPPPDETARVADALRRLKKGLRQLGAVVPPGMTRWRPMGSSVHYTGTLPMTSERASLTTDRYGRSRDFRNLFIVDGATFPFLPAKNLTFTLMANARRIARQAFQGGRVQLAPE